MNDLDQKRLERDGEDICIKFTVIRNSPLVGIDVVGPEWITNEDIAECCARLVRNLEGYDA